MYTFTQRVLWNLSWHRSSHALIFHDASATALTSSIVTRGKCAFVWTAAGSQHCMTLEPTDKVIVFNPTLLLRWWNGWRRHGGYSDWPCWAASRWNANWRLLEATEVILHLKLVTNTSSHRLCFYASTLLEILFQEKDFCLCNLTDCLYVVVFFFFFLHPRWFSKVAQMPICDGKGLKVSELRGRGTP